jgi:hypothetical protein
MPDLDFKTDEEHAIEQMREAAARLMGVDEDYLAAMEKLFRVCMAQNTHLN